jgi:hypothetical protein
MHNQLKGRFRKALEQNNRITLAVETIVLAVQDIIRGPSKGVGIELPDGAGQNGG